MVDDQWLAFGYRLSVKFAISLGMWFWLVVLAGKYFMFVFFCYGIRLWLWTV